MQPSLEYVPSDYFKRLDLTGVFGRTAPLEVDIGCGEGAFLVQQAALHPERNFLGVERLMGRVRITSRRARKAKLTNLRLLRIESSYTVQWLLPPGSAAVIHVAFPDPWPKHRHHPRRLVNAEFLKSCWNALAEEGELRLTTDYKEYFDQMTLHGDAAEGMARNDWNPDGEYPATDFEKRYRARNLPVYRARYIKAPAAIPAAVALP